MQWVLLQKEPLRVTDMYKMGHWDREMPFRSLD